MQLAAALPFAGQPACTAGAAKQLQRQRLCLSESLGSQREEYQHMCSQRPQWLPERESMRVEFKSDRALLSDRDIAAALACLANAEGGELWLGLEDDARIGGLHPLRGPLADLLER